MNNLIKIIIIVSTATLLLSCKKESGDEPNQEGTTFTGSLVTVKASSDAVEGADSIRFSISRKAETSQPVVINAKVDGQESASLSLEDEENSADCKFTFFSGSEISWKADGTASVVWCPDEMGSHTISLQFVCGGAKEEYSINVTATPTFRLEGLTENGYCLSGQSIYVTPVFEPSWYSPTDFILKSSDENIATIKESGTQYILKGVASGDVSIVATATSEYEWSFPMEVWSIVKANAYINSQGELAVELNGVATLDYSIKIDLFARSKCEYDDDVHDPHYYLINGQHYTTCKTRSFGVNKTVNMRSAGSTGVSINPQLIELLEGYETSSTMEDYIDINKDVVYTFGKEYYNPDLFTLGLSLTTTATHTTMSYSFDPTNLPTLWQNTLVMENN